MADILGIDFNSSKTRTGIEFRKPVPRPERKLRKANVELEKLVATDPLMEIASRRELTRVINEITVKDQDACMLYVDIDHFKTINDTYGHTHGGDIVLTILGKRLKSHVDSKDIVGREGGEEIIVILRDSMDLQKAKERAEEIRANVAENGVFLPDGRTVDFTVSIGVAKRQKGENWKDWKNRADQAMYQAKQGGRNQVKVA